MKTAGLQTETIEQEKNATEEIPTGSSLNDQVGEALRQTRRPMVVIVGAGFGGLNAARTLAKREVDVLVLDKNNYHGFWPLLYQVATAGREAESIAYPVRGIFRKYANVGFRMAATTGVDFDRKLLLTDAQPVPYDYLILAAGSANNYFGNKALAQETLGLKDIDEAEQVRNRVLWAFERAASEPDPVRRQKLLTFVMVGGGPTGVELSGALSDLINIVLRRDYPYLDVSETRVILVEASGHLLAAFPESLQKSAARKLKSMNVDVRLNMPVTSVEDGKVILKDGTEIEASIVVWAAGVRSAEIADALGVELARNARVKVQPTLNLAAHPEVFVIGDMAYLEGYKGGEAYPMVAQVAIQQGKRAAKNILEQVRGRPMRPFHY